ncbi:hypothetical protein WA158_000524 [Blastocystis sp. Blastoise]
MSSDHRVAFTNPYTPKPDVYYHLNLNSDMDLKTMFGDVRYVFLHGSPDRAHAFIQRIAKEFSIPNVEGPIGKTERYSLYKAGRFISCSHGMGMPSLSILLHELAKIFYNAGVLDDVQIIRLGTSGGLGVAPGTVVITSEAVDGELKPVYSLPICGKVNK